MYIEYFAYMYICAPYLCLVATEVRGSVGSPRTRATEVSEPPCECWESNLDLLQKATSVLSYPLSHFTSPLKLFVKGKK